MPDIFVREKRSEIMAGIAGKDTSYEILVRKYLFGQGFRYRKNVRTLPGIPDIVLPKYKTVVLVHGCFWHGHEGCAKASLPQTNYEFWRKKIFGNVERDKRNIELLKHIGWKVIVVWQDEISNLTKRETRLCSLVNQIKNNVLMSYDYVSS